MGSFPKDKQTHPACVASFIIFIVLFTFLRIYMMPVGFYMAVRDTATMWEQRGAFRSNFMWPNVTLGAILIALQFFWYYLIWRKLFKLVGKIINPTNSNATKDEPKQKES